MMNGHRFCYISKIKDSEKPIDWYMCSTYSIPDPENPRNLTTIKITTYLEGQVINCRKCLEQHETSKCSGNQMPKRNPKLEIFRGHLNPLSNFYPVKLSVEDQEYTSLEQGYQHIKAIYHRKPELAEKIMKSSNGQEAQLLGQTLTSDQLLLEWEKEHKLTTMKTLVNIKFVQCPMFSQKLMATVGKELVEGTRDTYWGSGLLPSDTAATPKEQ